MTQYLKELLNALTLCYGPSGREGAAANVIVQYLKRYTDKISIDASGNVIAKIPSYNPKARKILVDAHYDEISMYVTKISDNGEVFVGAKGVDLRTLLASEVIIHGLNEVFGVVAVPPVHMLSKEDRNKLPEFNELIIFTGYDAQKLKKLVKVGDPVTYRANTTALNGNCFCGKAMDNRSGVCALLCCLEILRGKRSNYELNFLFSTQEEINLSGAATGAFNIDPDIAISVDVTFGKTNKDNFEEQGEMGKGVMIGYAPILNSKISNTFAELAQRAKIPYQKEIMAGNTGTNCASITLAQQGVPAGLLSIPLRYMHTQVETLNIADIAYTAALLSEFLTN